MRKILLLLPICAIFLCNTLKAQNISIHQEQAEEHENIKLKDETKWDSVNNFVPQKKNIKKTKEKKLKKEVFGWHPYWSGTSYVDYDYSVLSEVSYFACKFDPTTGNPDSRYWKTTKLVDYAHAAGCRISLTVTLFKEHEIFLNNPTAIQTLIDTLITLVKFRNADGLNIDFEAIPHSQSQKFTDFVINITQQFHTKLPGSTISIAIPAVNWKNTFNVAAMNPYIDLFLIMGYGYYWSGSKKAGPIAPKNSGQIWTPYNTTRSIYDYINAGISPEKLCLAIPYYGRDWKTTDNSFPTSTLAKGKAVTYSQIHENYSKYKQKWDKHSSSSYYIYETAGSWNQCWFNGKKSLGKIYDMVIMKNIAGIGIWALSYDKNHEELNNMLKEKFSEDGNNQCKGTFSDMGGPKSNYYNNDNYTFTIAPKNTKQLKLIFDEFNVEKNHDTLFIYNGKNTNAPLIKYITGEYNSKKEIIADSGAITFQFHSNNENTKSGWVARWTCNEFENKIENITKKNTKIQIYPNPFSNNLTISIKSQKNEPIKLEIFNSLGQIVAVENHKLQDEKKTISLKNTSDNLKSGLYFLKITKGNELFIEKIIKK